MAALHAAGEDAEALAVTRSNFTSHAREVLLSGISTVSCLAQQLPYPRLNATLCAAALTLTLP